MTIRRGTERNARSLTFNITGVTLEDRQARKRA
jgi:hypothetical protein